MNTNFARHSTRDLALRLTPRDIAILTSIWSWGFATSAQVARRHFQWQAGRANGKINTRCLHRLLLLYLAGYLARDEQPQRLSEGRKPLVYRLTKLGAQVIALAIGVDVDEIIGAIPARGLSTLFLDHTLRTVDFRIAVLAVTDKAGWEVERWLDERALKRDQMKDYITLRSPSGARARAAVVPDGYFVLNTKERVFHQFVEIDVGTVTVAASKWGRRDWARRIAAYLEYYRSGQYHARYHTQSMRVLCVTSSARRLATLKEVTERVGGRSRFWFTTFDEVANNDVLRDPIWSVAGRPDRSALVW